MHGEGSAFALGRRVQAKHAPWFASNASGISLSTLRCLGAALVACVSLTSTRAAAQPHRVGAELWGQADPNVGLVVLQGSTRKYPYVDAEALLWAGVGPEEQIDALVVSVRVRDKEGRAEARLGRFILATGAVRAVQIDGGIATFRARSKTHFEFFGGAPVVGDFESREADWLAGARVSQGIGNRGAIGASYYFRADQGQRADEEVGADFAFQATDWLAVACSFAWEILDPGLANLQATISAQTKNRKVRGELFVQRRSPVRLLPQTSLFTVLGDVSTTMGGTNVRWRAAPRLDLWVNLALQDAQEDLGYGGSIRGVLRLDDEGKGSILGEARRLDVAMAAWTGLRTAAVIPLYRKVALMPEFELVIPDNPRDAPGRVWPWGRLALQYRPGRGWTVAAAGEASSNQFQRYDVRALARVSYQAQWPRNE